MVWTTIQCCRLQQLKSCMFSSLYCRFFRSNHTATQRKWLFLCYKKNIGSKNNNMFHTSAVSKSFWRIAFKSLKFTSNYCAYHKPGRFECARIESCHMASENLEYSEWIIWIFMVCFVLFGAWQRQFLFTFVALKFSLHVS